uniref:C2H2-type domain-containing protein n=1 Tax=Glossina brevipalpis TaxID=37001 RepID=A0A1A9WVG4_9MUSC
MKSFGKIKKLFQKRFGEFSKTSNNNRNKGQLDDVSDSEEETFEGRRVRFSRKAKLNNLQRSSNPTFTDSDETPQSGQALSSESSNQLQKKSKIHDPYCKCSPISPLKELQQHNTKHVPNTTISCFKCLAIFNNHRELSRHLRRHILFTNFQCNSCKLQFLTKSALVEHCNVKKHEYYSEEDSSS